MYRNIGSGIDVDVLTDTFRDAVVFRIRDTKLVIAAMYIPPSNSPFYDEIYFKNCELIMDHFSDMHTLIVGDLNSRVGAAESIYSDIDYKQNPDQIINRTGRILRDTCVANPNYVLLNGYVGRDKNFDSKFTFYRGPLRSQVDVALSNNLQHINSFSIMDKIIYSDHCPVLISCSAPTIPSLHTTRDCADGLFSYHHYDVNRIIRNPVPINRLNIPYTVSVKSQ